MVATRLPCKEQLENYFFSVLRGRTSAPRAREERPSKRPHTHKYTGKQFLGLFFSYRYSGLD